MTSDLAVSATRASSEDPLSGLRVAPWDGSPGGAEPPGEDWVEVRVRAGTLNHHDLWTLRGVGLPPERLPMVLGTDAAGVTADGRDVLVHAVLSSPGWTGDETEDPGRTLLSERHPGTFAPVVRVPARNLVDKPSWLSFTEAACLPTAWLTAYRMLFVRGGLRPGQTVLVQGAGGGVATAAVVLARAGGLRVWATSRSEDKRAAAEAAGAHATFAAGERLPDRVDAVIETVGAATWEHSVKALRPNGVIVVSGATTGDPKAALLRHLFFRQLRVTGSTMGTRGELVDLVRMLEATGARPVVDTTVPVAEAAEAFERLAEGRQYGKIALLWDDES
ncbi:MAG: zinc-binding dehydrogenase [Kineosporiaceae bacterium]